MLICVCAIILLERLLATEPILVILPSLTNKMKRDVLTQQKHI